MKQHQATKQALFETNKNIIDKLSDHFEKKYGEEKALLIWMEVLDHDPLKVNITGSYYALQYPGKNPLVELMWWEETDQGEEFWYKTANHIADHF